MTFLESVNEILGDRFSESKRASAKLWYNHRYGRLWSQEPWTFKMAFVNFTLPANQSTVSIGTLQRIHRLVDSTQSPSYGFIEAIRPEDLFDSLTGSGGVPGEFTIVNNTIYFERPASSQRTFRALGELAFVPLSADADEPLLPEEFHMAPVHGAISEGLRLENDPSWEAAEADFQSSIQDLRKSYLIQVALPADFSPGWP